MKKLINRFRKSYLVSYNRPKYFNLSSHITYTLKIRHVYFGGLLIRYEYEKEDVPDTLVRDDNFITRHWDKLIKENIELIAK